MLVADLADAFYVDADAVRDAVARRTSLNLVHLASATKVDVFLLTDEPFEVERMRTRQRVHVGDEPGLETYVDAPEHTVLRKLEWYDRGGQVSERQWRDVLGVLQVQGERLDQDRLRLWAAALGVSDLLERARAEAGGG